jgi:hypothetical protein
MFSSLIKESAAKATKNYTYTTCRAHGNQQSEELEISFARSREPFTGHCENESYSLALNIFMDHILYISTVK